MTDAGCIACPKQRDTGFSSKTEQRMAGIGEGYGETEGE
jgi:hypothetical protein